MALIHDARRAALAVGATLALAGAAAVAQDFPNRPVRFVVANTPGTTTDAVARLLGAELARQLGQPFVVDNKPGANGAIGYESVARAPADGHTLALAILSDLSILPLIAKELRFNPLRDLPGFIGLADGRLVFGTAAKNPWKTWDELIGYTRANPGKLNFGASGAQVRLPMEVVLGQLNLNAVYVPYNGGAPYFLALAAGDVQMGFIGDATMVSLGDKFRPLAVTGEQRLASLPGVPTLRELNLGQVRGLSMSLHLPAGTPKAIVDRMYQTTAKILQQPEVRAGFAKYRYDINVLDPDAVGRRLADEAKLYAEVAAKAGIKPQ